MDHQDQSVSLSSTTPSAIHLASLSTNQTPLQRYLHFIRTCYIRECKSSEYFQCLEVYLSNSSHSDLQEIKCIEVEGHGGSTTGASLAIRTVPFGSHKSTTRICVLEGFPSPDCMVDLGARYRLRPEFLLGHLEPNSWQTDRPQWYELPTVPSRRRNIIHTRVITLGRRQVVTNHVELRSYKPQRKNAAKRLRELDRCLFQQRRYGEARFRQVHVHNAKYFSVEQMISFCVAETDTCGDIPWAGKLCF